MAGPDLDLVAVVCASGLSEPAAGGIRDHDDLQALERMGCEGAVVGRAIAEKTLVQNRKGDS